MLARDLYKNALNSFLLEFFTKTDGKDREEYAFIKNISPENSRSKHDYLKDPIFLSEFFRSKEFLVQDPISIIQNSGSTTVFTTAGIQILEDAVHREGPIPIDKIFVSQPVVRTQFIDSVCDGTSISFVNLSTVIANSTHEQHFNALSDWFSLFDILGFNKELFRFYHKETEPKWGSKIFKNGVIKIEYNNIQIGDAVYIYDIPQNTRQNLMISDIGFGLERLRWMLSTGEYGDQFGIKGQYTPPTDIIRTLSLFAGSGLLPSNQGAGYRFRQISKKLNECYKEDVLIEKKIFSNFYHDWSLWTQLPTHLDDALEVFLAENKRNLIS